MLGVGSVTAGGLGAAVAVIPRLGVIALVLGVVAFAVGVPALRSGSGTASRKYARFGIVLALTALVLGLLNLAIQAELFNYFTAR